MLKAILKEGAIVPLQPVPADWAEGAALEIEKVDVTALDIDAWARLMDRLCEDSPIEEEQRMRAAIDEQHRQAKAQIRHEMGLLK